MPLPYATEGFGDSAIVFLHYFSGGDDWWILERDNDGEGPQRQCFGFACLDGDRDCAELGYISIAELIAAGVELDFHWDRLTTLGDVKSGLGL